MWNCKQVFIWEQIIEYDAWNREDTSGNFLYNDITFDGRNNGNPDWSNLHDQQKMLNSSSEKLAQKSIIFLAFTVGAHIFGFLLVPTVAIYACFSFGIHIFVYINYFSHPEDTFCEFLGSAQSWSVKFNSTRKLREIDVLKTRIFKTSQSSEKRISKVEFIEVDQARSDLLWYQCFQRHSNLQIPHQPHVGTYVNRKNHRWKR